jgi:hypothetical protein
VNKVETIALPLSYGTYNDTGTVAVSGAFGERTGWGLAGWSLREAWSQFLALRVRIPIKFGRTYPNRAPAGNDDPVTNTLGAVTFQPQRFHRLEKTRGTGDERAASVGRMNLEIGPLAIGLASGRYEVVVETWHESRFSSAYGAKQEHSTVPDTGHTVLAASDATALGLMPEGLRLLPDRSVRYRIPDGLESTLGSEPISTPPDAGAFVETLLHQVGARLGARARELVEEEAGKILGPYNGAAFLPEMSNGGTIEHVPIMERYLLPLPGGRHLGTLPANRTISILLKARMDGQQFLGVIPTKHYLGLRAGVERAAERYEARMARVGTDPLRFWNIFQFASGLVNALWVNWVLGSPYAQTSRKAGTSQWAEDSRGMTVDTSPGGAAAISRKVHYSAEVTVGTAPLIPLDFASSGATQTWQRFTIPEDAATASSVITRHDIHTLDREGVPAPPAPRAPGRQVPPAAVRQPGWEPELPAVTLGRLGRADSFAQLRQGPVIPAEKLAEIQVARPGDLITLRGKLARLLLPMAASYVAAQDQAGGDGSVRSGLAWAAWQNTQAVWANYGPSAPPGASLYKPQSLTIDQAHVFASNTHLTGNLPAMLTGARGGQPGFVTADIVLPGRLQWPRVSLEYLADVAAVHITGRESPNMMDKLFHAHASLSTMQAESLSGTLWSMWVNVSGQLRKRPYDYNNNLGPLVGADHIVWHTYLQKVTDRFGHDFGLKRTHLGMTQVMLGVHYSYGVNPYRSGRSLLDLARYWPGQRQYFRDDEVRWAEIWVPTVDKHYWEGLARQLAGLGSGVQRSGGGVSAGRHGAVMSGPDFGHELEVMWTPAR